LPHQFVLCGGGSSLPGIAEAVRSHGWMERLDFARHPEVRLLDPGDVDGVLDLTGQLEGQQHVTSMALASYAMADSAPRGHLEALLEPGSTSTVLGREGWA
jgi:cell division ATPase FtsA